MQAQPDICSATTRGNGRFHVRVRPIGIAAVELGVVCGLLIGMAPALALDDKEFCVSAQQLAIAAEKDVGVWIDRVTRNAGMEVSCDRKTVQFTRFTYAPSASMNDAWKASKSRGLERDALQQPDLGRSHRATAGRSCSARPPPMAGR